eukprot:gene16842-8313_t
MGSGASSNYESSKDTNKFKRRSLSNILGRQSPTQGRPLPKGPGPLLPSSGLRKGRKKTDVTPSQAKGPVKGNHLLAKGGSHNVPRTEVSSPEEHRSLSRLKSRSLDDIRNVEKRESIKLNPDKISVDLDMKKARKAFKISRSPSFDNINTARRQTESDQRALLDRLSKMSTDEASKNAENSVKNRKSLSDQYSTSSIYKDNIFNPLKNLLPKSSIQSKPEARIDNGGKSSSSIPRKDSLGRNRINSQEQSLQRRSSDSAYESNSSTGSSSGNSSPKLSRDQVESQGRKVATDAYGKGLVGLRNLGNTCFMNSILQCLRNLRKLRAMFCNEAKINKLLEATPQNKGGLAKAFTNVVREMWSHCSTGVTITPHSLKLQVQKYAPRFVGYNQQDSQEFLRFLLEGLHDDLNISREKLKDQPSDTSSLSDTEQARAAWERYERREKSIISDLFVGQLKSTLTCTECKYRSLTFDPFWDLSLPIPSSRSRTSLLSGKVSLDDCFKRFTQEEVLDGDEKPTCEKCKKRRKCLKQFSIERFPQILVIHLKRFSGLRYRTKLETMIDFPLALNLSSYAASNATRRSEAQYNLYGISNHSGGTYSGHYTAYCKHPDTDDWFYYSDSRISKLDRSRIVTEEAYVLFYELSNQMSVL